MELRGRRDPLNRGDNNNEEHNNNENNNDNNDNNNELPEEWNQGESNIYYNDDLFIITQMIKDGFIKDNFDTLLYDTSDTNNNRTRRITIDGIIINKVPIDIVNTNINKTIVSSNRNYTDVKSYTLLHSAVLGNNVNLAIKLIDTYKADPNVVSEDNTEGNTIIYPVIFYCESLEMFNVLHERHAIIDMVNLDNEYPTILFYYANAYRNYISNPQFLQENEFSIEYYKILKRIIELGVLNYADKVGNTVLYLYPTYGLAKLLITDNTSYEFDINLKNNQSETILFGITNDVRLIKYYHDELHLDFNEIDNYNNNIVYKYTIVLDNMNKNKKKYPNFTFSDVRNVLYEILKYGVNVNNCNIYGICPLFVAQNKDTITALVESGNVDEIADVNYIDIRIKNEYGRNKAFYFNNVAGFTYFNTVLEPDEISDFYNTLDNDNSNALYYTCNKNVFKSIVDMGNSIYHINNKGESIIFGLHKSIFPVNWSDHIMNTLNTILFSSQNDNRVDYIFKKVDNNGRNILHHIYIQMYILNVFNYNMDNPILLKRMNNIRYSKFFSYDSDIDIYQYRMSLYNKFIAYLLDNELVDLNTRDKCNNTIFSYITYEDQLTSIQRYIEQHGMDSLRDIDVNGVYNDKIEGTNTLCEFDDYPNEGEKIVIIYPGDNILLRRYEIEEINEITYSSDIYIYTYIELLNNIGADINKICNYKSPRTGNTVMHFILKQLDDKHGSINDELMVSNIKVLQPYNDITITNNDGKTVIDLARIYIEKYKDTTSLKLKRIFLIGSDILNKKYTGMCKETLDAQMDDFFTAEDAELVGEHKKKRVYFSHCPVCIMPVGRTVGCVYMSHDCKEVPDNIYQSDLYDKFNMGGKIEWCTICGRITHNHTHYSLLPHDTTKSEFTDHPIPVGMPTHDYWSCPGGNGIKEKVARMITMREKFIEANEFVGVKNNKEVYYPIIEAMFDAPLKEDNLLAGQAALDNNAWPSPISELTCDTGAVKERRIKPYTLPGDLNMPEFVKVGENEYTYTSDETPLWKLKHRMENGEFHPDEQLIGENVVIRHLVTRGERLGLCPVRECGVLFYPEEVETILKGSDRTEINNVENISEEYGGIAGATKKSVADSYREFFTNQYYRLTGKEPEYIKEGVININECSLPRVGLANEVVPEENIVVPVPENELNPQEGGKGVNGSKRDLKRTYRVHKKSSRKTIKRKEHINDKVLHKMSKAAAKTLYKKTKVKNMLKSKSRRV
jgi:hypothetical protein